ncbi:polyprenol reductase-like [Mizuhopecten yessoensis]|uniref:Polyprenal reductase n=1 Tax=Mizuhopecten yessoensis TaxID=6573 RepID=A0A210PNH2_MIZYE|nr:polyprenol reductase-like [Mizuhopecten yessoensis]OWF38055.1 Polyprenol reductase [Mizuhopecten yessoensis]
MYLLSVVWNIATLAIILGYLTVEYSSYFPTFIHDLYLFGKVRKLDGFKLPDSIVQVPKSWFRHFYLTGVVVNSAVLAVTLYTFCGSGVWPECFKEFLTFIGNPGKESEDTDLTAPLPIVLAIVMEEIQVVRRTIETLCINSYSTSKMSLVIYVVGMLFYSSIGISILSLSKAGTVSFDDFNSLSWLQWYAVALFLYASYKQYHVNRIMAKLRQDKNGNVTNTKHHIPHGDLFEYVSCPHFLMEIIIYFAITTVVGWEHEVCMCLWLFVLTNQLIEGYLVHRWYKEVFPNYPPERKAVVPYLL